MYGGLACHSRWPAPECLRWGTKREEPRQRRRRNPAAACPRRSPIGALGDMLSSGAGMTGLEVTQPMFVIPAQAGIQATRGRAAREGPERAPEDASSRGPCSVIPAEAGIQGAGWQAATGIQATRDGPREKDLNARLKTPRQDASSSDPFPGFLLPQE